MKTFLLMVSALALGCYAVGHWATGGSNGHMATGSASIERGRVVAYFTATWCGACKRVKPDVAALSDELAGRVDFIAVDVDRQPELAQRARIEGVPTLIVLKDGVEKTRFFGGPKEMMKAQIVPWL